MYATRREIAQLIQRTIKTADDAKFKDVYPLSSHETIASHADVLIVFHKVNVPGLLLGRAPRVVRSL